MERVGIIVPETFIIRIGGEQWVRDGRRGAGGSGEGSILVQSVAEADKARMEQHMAH